MEKKRRIIVSVTNDLSTDQRVRKVCAFLHEQKYEVLLCGRVLDNSIPITDRPYPVKRFKLFINKGPLFYAIYNFRLWLFLIFTKTDYVLANDLDTLFANAWAKRFKKNCVLVYDAHEYFTEVPEIQNKPIVKKVWQWIERTSLPQVDHFYTVNKSIAALYQKQTSLPVQIVRNISDPKKINSKYSKKDLGLPENKKIVIMQGAGINIDRGAEEAVEAIQLVDHAVLIFVGDGDVITKLKKYVVAKKLTEKVLFFPKQPYEKLMNYTLHSDIGLTLDKPTNINYKLALPNKVFDYIHAGLPIVATNLVEIKNIVGGYHVGRIVDECTGESIAKEINTILKDAELSKILKENCKKAAIDLTWHNETKVLARIYA